MGHGRLTLLATAAIALAPALGAGPASAASTPVDDACAQAAPSALMCTGLDKLAEAGSATCRRAGAPDDDCVLPAGHAVRSSEVDAYGDSWVHRAVAAQFALGDTLPFSDAQWIGTHNSFNSVNDTVTASHTDSNQQLSLTQQLDIDVRALELDVHYVPSVDAAGSDAVVVCHGRGADEAHFGCTTERRLVDVLPEIADWLNAPAHRRQVILLYLEDELGADAGYAPTLQALDGVLRAPDGHSLIYRPAKGDVAPGGCAQLPLSLSRADVRRAGAQVVLVGNCRSGWAPDVYGWDAGHVESGSTADYKAYPACDATYPRSVYATKLVRYFEDSTFVSDAVSPTTTPAQDEAGRLSPAKVAAMTACGVNLLGLDQILPGDGRLEATVWSWAPGEPSARAGRCALQRADGRWVAAPCGDAHRAACRTADGGWALTPAAVAFPAAKSACAAAGATFDVPRAGDQNALLRQAAGTEDVWLRDRVS